MLAEVALIYFLALALNSILIRWKQRREETEQDWPSVEGNIQYASVAVTATSSPSIFDSMKNEYCVTLEYSYFVGEYRSGKYVRVFGDDFESEANDLVERMKDKKVRVRYNPSNPDESVLDPSFIEQHTMPPPV